MYDEPAPHAAEDLALIQFSSGSTGLQKGATLSHRAILAEMQSMKLRYPELPQEQKKHLLAAKRFLLAE